MPAEIERVFLLRGMPVPMPEGVPLRIEQGYLPPSAGDALEGPGVIVAACEQSYSAAVRAAGQAREELLAALDAATGRLEGEAS